MRYTTLLFDLDDTLYESGNGLWEAIRQRMSQYMIERIGLPAEDVPVLRAMYFKKYGTTLRGLQRHYQVDSDDYLAYVHDLPLELYLKPAPQLRSLLNSLPQRRWIFTNADAGHAGRVLSKLELADCFEGIIDVRAIQFACKPEPIAYQRALALAGKPRPSQCVMLDDSLSNLGGARQMEITTVLVGKNGAPHPAVDYTVPNLLDLPQAVPELWDI